MMYIRQAQAQALPTSDPAAASGPVVTELRALYLLALHQYGRTLVPVLGYVPMTYEAAPPLELHLLMDLAGTLWGNWG